MSNHKVGWSQRALLSGQTEEQVLSILLGSQEFFNRAQTLAGSGTADERFVKALYQLLFNRTPGANEVSIELAP